METLNSLLFEVLCIIVRNDGFADVFWWRGFFFGKYTCIAFFSFIFLLHWIFEPMDIKKAKITTKARIACDKQLYWQCFNTSSRAVCTFQFWLLRMQLTFHSIMIRPLSAPLFAWAIEFPQLIDCQYQLFRWNEDRKFSLILPKLFDFAETQAITCNVKFGLFDQTWHEPTGIDDWKPYPLLNINLYWN